MILKKLRECLPVSRRKYEKTIQEMYIILNGLSESDANHCQIEVSLIQALQKGKNGKNGKKKATNGNGDKKIRDDPAFM